MYGTMSRGTWVGRTDSGYSRSFLKAKGLTPFYSPLDPGAVAHMTAWRSETNSECGLYIDPHWYGLAADGHALDFRKVVDDAIASLLRPGEPVSLDLEVVSLDYVRRLFLGSSGNRGLLRSGNTAKPTGTQQGLRILRYTNEPFKNGTVVPTDVFARCSELQWDPQMYYGNMSSAAEAAVVLEIARWGINSDVIHPFRDGMLIASDDRDAMYFTAERLPGMFGGIGGAKLTVESLQIAGSMTKKYLRDHYTELANAA